MNIENYSINDLKLFLQSFINIKNMLILDKKLHDNYTFNEMLWLIPSKDCDDMLSQLETEIDLIKKCITIKEMLRDLGISHEEEITMLQALKSTKANSIDNIFISLN